MSIEAIPCATFSSSDMDFFLTPGKPGNGLSHATPWGEGSEGASGRRAVETTN